MAHRSALVLSILFGAAFAVACGGSDEDPPINPAGAGGSGTAGAGGSSTGGTGASSGTTGKGGTGTSGASGASGKGGTGTSGASGTSGKGGSAGGSAGVGGTGTAGKGGSAGAGATGGTGSSGKGGTAGTGATGGTSTAGSAGTGTGTGGTTAAGAGGTDAGGTAAAGSGGSGTGGTDAGGTGGTGGTSAGCGMVWEATYDLTGVFSITDTTFGAGDTSKDIGPGTIKIRFDDVNGAPGGTAHVLSYAMAIKFEVKTLNVTVDTDVNATVPENACGHASGTVTGSNLVWDACTYGPTWNTGAGKWHGDANAASGVGCLNDYTSAGNVQCTQSMGLGSCSQGNLQQGANAQNGTWAQPLNGFEMSADLKTFKMNMLNAPAATANNNKYKNKGVETPNAQPSRTWFTLSGTQSAITQVAKDCSCM